tara:strand:+ start:31323 stop:32672 length:1350 start_codon:yes stop_codon:yes gene_type:complete
MGKYFLKLPKMGESIAEATLIGWLKDIGDSVQADESVFEIATDKVDSDVPSEYSGKLLEKRFEVNDIIKVGEVIAVIESNEVQDNQTIVKKEKDIKVNHGIAPAAINAATKLIDDANKLIDNRNDNNNLVNEIHKENNQRFYSPLVKNIAKKESVSKTELESINGSGKNGRVTKKDILNYLKNRNLEPDKTSNSDSKELLNVDTQNYNQVNTKDQDQLIEMSRMGKLLANHMIESKKVSAHVQSFVEVDVTNLCNWREKIKNSFFEQTNEKLTYTPLFILAVIKALRDFPILNSSVLEESILQKKEINIGMATALNDGSLIVPVIKNADHLNLIGLTKAVNDLAHRARKNKLLPEEVQGGTYTVTNVGNFGSIMGTPIINQPEVGILAIGVIRKMPAVIETNQGDYIGIRKKLILSHSYDHRIINGAVGSQFAKNVSNYLEDWDLNLSF